MLTLLCVVAVATTLLVFSCFALYLSFCRFVVRATKGTAGLRDVAVAMRAFAALPLPRSRSRSCCTHASASAASSSAAATGGSTT